MLFTDSFLSSKGSTKSEEIVVFGIALLALIFCSIASISFFFKRNEELPFFLCFYTGMVLVRLYLLEQGQAEWVNFDYGIYFEFTMEEAYNVATLMILGTVVLVACLLSFSKPPPVIKKDNSSYLKQFLAEKRTLIIGLFILFYFFQLMFRNSLSHGYATNIVLANSSFVILLFLLFYKSDTTTTQKVFFSILTGVIAYSTYSSENRFQFLGWVIPIALLLLQKRKPFQKLLPLGIGMVAILLFFSIARTLRSSEVRSASTEEIYEAGVSRLLEFEDINFIDGFMMLHQVYPDYLDYHYGMDHLAIFFRPVPRSLWPGKPAAGWHQKYAEKYNYGESFEAGFSPTLYGVFYGEGGVMGIVIFSIIWGWFLARLSYSINSYDTDLYQVLKGVLIASLIPVLRSGDLAGDIAVVGMSYWPIFTFLYLYGKFIKKEKQKEYIKLSELA